MVTFPAIRAAYVQAKTKVISFHPVSFPLIRLTDTEAGKDPRDTASSLHHALA